MPSNYVEIEARRTILAERALACSESMELERFASFTAELFQVSRAAVSVNDSGRQKIIAGIGLEDGVASELEMAINRATGGLLRGSDAAVGQPQPWQRMRFVEWAPLRCDAETVGCLVVADEAPRQFSARGGALLEMLAALVLDQLYLICVSRKLNDLGRKRLDELRATAKENRALKQRLAQVARLGRFGGWVADIGSDQILWTDDLPDRLTAETCSPATGNLLQLAERSGREAIRQALRRTTEYGVPLELDLPVRLADGETRWLRMLGEMEPGEGGAHRVVGIIQDVSERYRADDKIGYLSRCDPLTGLPNRAAFQDRLQAAVRWAERTCRRGAVLVLDIDGFSDINDAIGYDGGDTVLARLAERLSGVVRACDHVARLAGDRFGVSMAGVEAAGDVMKFAERLLETTADALRQQPGVADITASIGVAVFPADGSAAPQLLRAAEIALDCAKAAGGGTYAFFTSEMAALAGRRRHLMAEVRAGLDADQFVVAYQPKIDLRSNRLAGFEALIRWAHPDRGLLSPGAFWEALEDPGVGKRLSDTVLVKVARQLAHWRQSGLDVGPVAVNIAAGQLRDPGFLQQIRTLLRQSDLPASALNLEITEGVLLGRRSDRTVRALNGIHEIGIDADLDDFGTGYASLSHLRQIPVNRLKIDKSFITDLVDPHNDAIVHAVIEMAHGLNIEVIAEGVETADTDRRLRELGCEYGQGFYYSRPIAAEEVAGLVRQWERALRPASPLRLIK